MVNSTLGGAIAYGGKTCQHAGTAIGVRNLGRSRSAAAPRRTASYAEKGETAAGPLVRRSTSEDIYSPSNSCSMKVVCYRILVNKTVAFFATF